MTDLPTVLNLGVDGSEKAADWVERAVAAEPGRWQSGDMQRPKLPHPHLIILRSVATLIISCIIGQAGWAAAFLGGSGNYFPHHQVTAVITMVVSVLGAMVYLVLRRSAGLVNVVLAIALAAGIVAQYVLGETGMASLHIFWGILLVMLGTALTSWTYRHEMPSPGSAV
ncbi:MAG: hypothetical protein ACTHWA_06565 [Arachnia sp.]